MHTRNLYMSRRLPALFASLSLFHCPLSLSNYPSIFSTFLFLFLCPSHSLSLPQPCISFSLYPIGKVMSFQDIRRLLNGGDAFLLMLQQFCLDDITDARLLLAETYVDNPMFRPVNVEVRQECSIPYLIGSHLILCD